MYKLTRVIDYIKERIDNYMYPILIIYSIGFSLLILMQIIDSIIGLDLISFLFALLSIVIAVPAIWVFIMLFQFLARGIGFDKIIASLLNNDKYLRKDK